MIDPQHLPDLLRPWQPGPADSWDRRKAAHLYRRAGFGPTLPEMDRALDADMDTCVTQLMDVDTAPGGLDNLMQIVRTELVRFDDNLETAQSFWLYRMIASDQIFEEKVALFWHYHFATANYKVQSPTYMYRQYETLRDNGLGRFDDLLLAVARDPAMLIWLDNQSNRREQPNENFARELLELFTMGPGAYSETDIREAARAFTGWHREGDRFVFRENQHDAGEKTFLGQTGPWNGDDIIRLAAARPETARFLARKMLSFFVMPEPSEEAIAALAAVYDESDHHLGTMLGVLLRSRLFYSEAAYRSLIRSPIEMVVGSIRLLDANSNRDMALPAMLNMGQELFNPPDVKGWDGGEAWINTVTTLERANFLNNLLMRSPVKVEGRDHLLLQRLKDQGLRQPAEVIDYLLSMILQGDAEPLQRQILIDYYKQELAKLDQPNNRESWDFKLRRVAYMMMTLPAYQLS